MKLIDEDLIAIDYLYANHKVEFIIMFYDLSSEGMDIKTAIWECWNKLKCGGVNGRI